MKNNWQTKKVGDCLEKIPSLGSVFSSQNLQIGNFPIIDQGQDFITGYTNDKSLVFSDCLPVIIFGDHTRALKFIDFPFAVGADGTKILKPKAEFDPRFFYYMLLSLDLGSRGYARHFKLLKESEIPLPPLKTQKEIVAKLGEKMGKIKEAKKLREVAIADTEKILSQTLREIFEEGKEKGWEEVFLRDVSEVVGGGTPSTSVKGYWDQTYAWATPKDLGRLNSVYINKTDKTISELGLKNSSAKLLPIGSIVFSSRAPIGYLAINTVPMATNQGCRNFVCSDKIINKFLYYSLVFNREYIKSLGSGSTFAEISGSKLKEIIIFIPSLSEQKKIVTRLDALSEKIRKAVELQKSQLEDLKKLEKAYLREAFNGELI
ncbi:MAG: restriction endonuclease subunit S [Candidatus Paceibacterota bacterium]